MEMNKIVSNIRYKMSYQFTWIAWYLVIYVITISLVYFGLIKTSVINNSTGSLFYRLWGSVIFLFAITIRFKEDFDFLLTLSNTRNDIFKSLLGATIGLSAFFSSLIVLEGLIVDSLNNIFEYHNITDPFHFFAPYSTDNILLQFVFFLMLCACCSIFGLMMGSLFYRFGKKFTLAFWIIFSAIPMVFFPLFSRTSNSIKAMGEFLRNFDVLAGSGYLLLLTLVFSLAAYLNIRRLPQK